MWKFPQYGATFEIALIPTSSLEGSTFDTEWETEVCVEASSIRRKASAEPVLRLWSACC